MFSITGRLRAQDIVPAGEEPNVNALVDKHIGKGGKPAVKEEKETGKGPVTKEELDTTVMKKTGKRLSVSPGDDRISSMTREHREALKAAVNSLLQGMGNPEGVTFMDLVRATMDKYGEEVVRETFNTIANGWKLTGRTLPDTERLSVYDALLGNPEDPMAAIKRVQEEINAAKARESEEGIDNVETDKVDDDAASVGEGADLEGTVDTNNQVVVTRSGRKVKKELIDPETGEKKQIVATVVGEEEFEQDYGDRMVSHDPTPTLAGIAAKEYKVTREKKDGVIKAVFKIIRKGLAKSKDIDPTPIWDWDDVVVGTELELRVPPKEQLDTMQVPIHQPDGSIVYVSWKDYLETQPMPWGHRRQDSNHSISEGSIYRCSFVT